MSRPHALADDVASRNSPERIALSPAEAAEAIGVSRAFLYRELLSSGKLASFSIGRRRFIGVDALRAFAAQQNAGARS